MPNPFLTPDPQTTRAARALLDPPEGSRALEVLATIADLKAGIATFEATVVFAARTERATWEEIGDVVGMTRQNTRRKFAPVMPRLTVKDSAR